jgi:hypothetical protein
MAGSPGLDPGVSLVEPGVGFARPKGRAYN